MKSSYLTTRVCPRCSMLNRTILSSTCRISYVRGFAAQKTYPYVNVKQPKAPNHLKGPRESFRDARAPPEYQQAEYGPSEETVKPSRAERWRRLGLTPKRIIWTIVLFFGGYKLYNWKTNLNRSLTLNGKYFSPFILESKDYVSSTSSVFNLLSVPAGQSTYNITQARKLGTWSVQVLQPELQLARSYTPLPFNEKSAPEEIRLYVRKEPQGEVSGFLHRIFMGTMVHLRGPHPEYIIPNDVEEVLFLAGGTGIAPAMQVVDTLFTARDIPPEQKPRIRILWANRRVEDSYDTSRTRSLEDVRASILAKARSILKLGSDSSSKENPSLSSEGMESQQSEEQTIIVRELEALKAKHGEKLSVDYFIDEKGSYITESLLRGELSRSSLRNPEGSESGTRLLLVSGPEGFVDAFAGAKTMKKGKELQGPLGGVLDRIRPEGWTVWKL